MSASTLVSIEGILDYVLVVEGDGKERKEERRGNGVLEWGSERGGG